MVRLGYSVPHCIEQGYTRGMAHLLQQVNNLKTKLINTNMLFND